MIKFKRGSTDTWNKNDQVVLDDGQPGYDKGTFKLKVGDGETPWKDLPYLKIDLVPDEEATEITDVTYGPKAPGRQANSLNFEPKGRLYLQQFEGAAEVDYVIETGRNINYFWRKWNSGFMECWGKGEVPGEVDKLFKTKVFEVKTDLIASPADVDTVTAQVLVKLQDILGDAFGSVPAGDDSATSTSFAGGSSSPAAQRAATQEAIAEAEQKADSVTESESESYFEIKGFWN